MQLKEAVEIWKANRQQRNEEAKKRKAGRVQNNDPAVLEVLKNVSQKGGGSSASDEPGTKKMLFDVIEDHES